MTDDIWIHVALYANNTQALSTIQSLSKSISQTINVPEVHIHVQTIEFIEAFGL